jgi:hypothetical protein
MTGHASLRVIATVLVLLTIPAAALAGGRPRTLPFAGYWEGQTIDAMPTDDPAVIAVTSAGDGLAVPLGRYTMVSPHLSHLDTLEAEGLQLFETARGDELTAEFTGQFTPTPDGKLFGVLDAAITGGTGKFASATGSYTFYILFDPATFQSIAVFEGTVALPGRS